MQKRLETVVYENTQLKPNKCVNLKFSQYEDKFFIIQKLSIKGWLMVLLSIPFFLLGCVLIIPAKLLLKIHEYTFKKVLSWLNNDDALSIFLNGNKGRYFYSNEELTNKIKDVIDESNEKTSDS